MEYTKRKGKVGSVKALGVVYLPEINERNLEQASKAESEATG